MRSDFMKRKGKLQDLDRSFDLQFWQSQPAQARFDALWEMIIHYTKVKGQNILQLRLQGSITNFQRQSR